MKYSVLIISSFFIFGCANLNVTEVDLITRNQNAADQLVSNLKEDLSGNAVILVASFADIDDLEKSSTLGRLLGEQLSSRFSRLGYTVKEIKLSQNNVFVKQGQGEFILSRNIKNITKDYSAEAIVAGTYAVAKDTVYISAKMIKASNDVIISTFDYTLPKTANILALLTEDSLDSFRYNYF